MQHHEVEALAKAAPNEVWSLILNNGLELVSQLHIVEGLIPGASPTRIVLYKPFQVRCVSIPVPTREGINVNTTPQLQPLTWFHPTKELQIEADQIWNMLGAPKHISDGYLEQTSGIALARG